MSKDSIHLCWSASRAVTAVPQTDEAEILIDLANSPRYGSPAHCQRPYTLHLTPEEARKMAIRLMREADEARELDRAKKSP